MKQAYTTLSLAASALLLNSCGSITPMDRIAENPAAYQALTPAQQTLVREGKIEAGMPPQAVYIAWGNPAASPIEGYKDGKNYTRWVYSQLEPVYTTPAFWGGPYWGPGPYGRRRYYGGFYTGTDVTYIPRNVANVLFENGKVVSWETAVPR